MTALSLTTRELALLESALTTLQSPLDYSTVSEWRAACRHQIGVLLGADKSTSLLPMPGERPEEVDPDDAKAASAYIEYYHVFDTGFLQRRRELGLEVHHWSEVYDLSTLRKTEIYNDWSRPHGLLDATGMTFDFPDAPFPAAMLFYHSKEGSTPFGARGVALLRLLLPAFKAGVHCCVQLARSRSVLTSMADGVDHGMIVFDRSGRTLYENATFGHLLDGNPEAGGVRLEALRIALAMAAPHQRRVTTTRRPLNDSPLGDVRTVRGSYTLRGIYLPEGLFAREVTVCVTLQRDQVRELSSDVLRKQFRLTAREIEVARLLAQGLANQNVAERLGISAHTAERHTEQVLLKLGIHSRAAVGACLRGERPSR